MLEICPIFASISWAFSALYRKVENGQKTLKFFAWQPASFIISFVAVWLGDSVGRTGLSQELHKKPFCASKVGETSP